jgi:hypothetical protein
MSQTASRHDSHAKPGDDEDAYVQPYHAEHKQNVRSGPPVAEPADDDPATPDEPTESEFQLIGDDDLSPADLGPAAPNVKDPDRDSGRLRKITR